MARDLDQERPLTVAVRPGSALDARPRLFRALEQAFPVLFKPGGSPREGLQAAIRVDAIIEFCGDADLPTAEQLRCPSVPVLAIGSGADGLRKDETVRIADHEAVDRRVRGIELGGLSTGPALGRPGEGEHVLASTAASAVWTVTAEGSVVHRVGFALSELEPDQVLRDLFARSPLVALALVHFLRGVTGDRLFEDPPLRAVFLFDDPNLRWRTYGFLDYKRLLEHADTHGYHASMAMIPRDGWWLHRPTVRLFRDRPDRLSLVFHGNNHVSQELMRPRTGHGALAVAAQASQRVARFESRHALEVGRVMTPPHGLCSSASAEALASLGFDALCAVHALPWTPRPPADRLLTGWEPAEFTGGCAVIPRITFSTSVSEMAIRAFLGQPLVLYGHHDDLAGGLDLLAQTAARVNSLGDVSWTSLGRIAATNCSTRIEGESVRVRPYSRRLVLQLQPGHKSVTLETPRDPDGRLVGWSASDSALKAFNAPRPCSGDQIEIRLRGVDEVDPASVAAPPWQPWPVLRRIATEARDRAVVLRSRVSL